MDDIAQALASALQFHRDGNTAAAERLYREILIREPAHHGALDLLGMAALQQGRPLEAVELISRAVEVSPNDVAYLTHLGNAYAALQQWEPAAESFHRAVVADPNSADAYFHLGLVERKQGQFERAAESFERAVAIDPARTDAHFNLGNTWKDLGRFDAAERCYREAVRRQPRFLMALSNLGNVLRVQGRLEEAVETLRQVVELQPSFVPIYLILGTALRDLGRLDEAVSCFSQALAIDPNFAEAHDNLGMTLQALGRLDEATACYAQAVRLNPQLADAHNNLGVALQGAGRFDEAMACYEQALRLNPHMAEAHSNLAMTLQMAGRFEDALRSCREAIRLRPDLADAHSNLGVALQAAGRFDEALASYDEAIRLKPEYAEAHYNRAFILLSRGDFGRGWAAYEWRLKCKDYPGPKFHQPLWDGSEFTGRTLLVHAEQGFGDVLNFIRYVPLVRRRGGKVFLLLAPDLIPLLATSGYENLIAAGADLPEFDLHAPLLSLPGILDTRLETIPNQVPYLDADPRRIAHWRRRLAAIEGFKVGIAWQGNPNYTFDRFRSVPLTAFGPLAEVPGVRLVSLQKGPGTEQIAAAAEQVPVVDLGPDFDGDAAAFMDTAAVIKNLDLVVSPDSAVAHLASGMGVPVWLAVCCCPEWRWMTDRDDSPWYPTMRLFRQQKPKEWEDVFGRMAAAIRVFLGNRLS